MRIVIDTNVLVRVFMSPQGPAAELLSRIAADHRLIVSSTILSEVYDVLQRSSIRRLHRLDDSQIRKAISRLYKLGAVVSLPPNVPQIVPHDPKDDPIVMTAIVGQASFLCTLDKHLRCQEVVDYCAGHGIKVVSDVELLQLLG